jgi:hypothetical protein
MKGAKVREGSYFKIPAQAKLGRGTLFYLDEALDSLLRNTPVK